MIHKAFDEEESNSSDSPTTVSVDNQPTRQVGRGKINILIGMGIGVIVTLGATQILSSDSSSQSTAATPVVTETTAPAQTVTVATTETTSVDRTLKATGTVNAYELIPVLSQATGLQIRNILVEENEFVKKGQLLASLDDSVLNAQLAQAQASVKEAEARLAELTTGTRAEELARARENVKIAQAEVAQAESAANLAKTRLERNQNLQAEGAIAQDRLDEFINTEREKQSELLQAQASLREAQQQLAELEAGPRPETILQAQAQLAQAKAQLQLVNSQLEDTRVIAPVSGLIAERNARVGDISSNSETLFTIIENGRLELRLTIPETQLGMIKPGQEVKITASGDSNLILSGRVREIDPIVNEESRQATVKVDLPAENNLKPGMFKGAEITTSQTLGLTIPAEAALPQSDGSAIAYVVQGDTVKAQRIELGEILPNSRVEIISGLTAQDKVVVKGAAYLKDGDRISIITE